jgi:hypothetical protein
MIMHVKNKKNSIIIDIELRWISFQPFNKVSCLFSSYPWFAEDDCLTFPTRNPLGHGNPWESMFVSFIYWGFGKSKLSQSHLDQSSQLTKSSSLTSTGSRGSAWRLRRRRQGGVEEMKRSISWPWSGAPLWWWICHGWSILVSLSLSIYIYM